VAPSAGKTTVLREISEHEDDLVPDEAVIIDPAEIRTLLPEWAKLVEAADSSAAARVRAEAIYMARNLFEQAVERGLNIIIEGVGAGAAGAFADLLRRRVTRVTRCACCSSMLPPRSRSNGLRLTRTRAASTFDAGTIRRLHSECSLRFREWSQVEGVRAKGFLSA
jgi:hypothetical protein